MFEGYVRNPTTTNAEMEEEWTKKKQESDAERHQQPQERPKKEEKHEKKRRRKEKKMIKKGVYNIGTRLTVRVGRQTTGTSTAVLTLTSQHLAYDAARGYSEARFKMWSPDVCAWNGGKAT